MLLKIIHTRDSKEIVLILILTITMWWELDGI